MTSMTISNHKHQTAGSAASVLPADSLATDTQPAGPFAFLLAQQIGEADLSAMNTALAAIAVEGDTANDRAGSPSKDAQDQAAAANVPGDPAGIIAAILQQLPAPEDRGQKIDAYQTTETIIINAPGKTDGSQTIPPLALDSAQEADSSRIIQPFTLGSAQATDGPQTLPATALNSVQATDGSQTIPSFTLNSLQQADDLQAMRGTSPETGYSRSEVILPDNKISQNPSIDHLSSEAVKREELLSGLTQTAQSATQTVAPPSGYAAMPVTLTNNMLPADVTPTVDTPLGHPGWADEFSQKISWISTQQNQIAELHLNPPNLGPLDVMLEISDNQATILFSSPHGAVRDAVENALPKLREILADNGIMLGNTTVSDQSPRDRGMDGFMGQGFGAAAQHVIDDTVSEPAGPSLVPVQTITARRHNGMVDTFA